MADEEKTEAATPRKREKEREKGNISKSQDMNSALTLSIGVGLLAGMAPMILSKLKTLFQYTFTHINPQNIEINDITALFAPFMLVATQLILPFLIVLAVAAAIIIRTQVGALFSVKVIQPKFDKLAPASIFKGLKKTFNLFSAKNIMEITKSFIKVIAVGGIGYATIKGRENELYGLIGADIHTGFILLGSILMQMLINMCIMMLIIGIIDKAFQHHQFEKSIKMSKQEVKDEWKNMDGDPKIKARIRAAQMQIMRQKMMSQVPQADVIVTNPTHFAVAIKYNKEKAPAPIVIAKGVDFMAFKIREIAKEHNIPIVENKPVARALYKMVPVDSIIPAELYVAVAEILAYVYGREKVK